MTQRASAPRERFELHARIVAVLTFVSRITGLVRDAALSRVFGAGSVMDAFFFAFMIPNLFRRLFGEGALAAAFLPVYARLDQEDPATARRLASALLAFVAVGLGGLVVVLELLLAVVPTEPGGHGALALRLLAIMLPYMPLVCLVALLGAILQVRRRFGPTAAAPVLLNLAVIAAALAGAVPGWFDDPADRTRHIALVAAAVVAAGVLQLAWSLVALRSSGERWWTARWAGGGEALRSVLGQAVPMIVGLGVLQLNTFLDGLIASYPTTVGPTLLGAAYPLDEGAMAAISFAQRLYQFPLGVFGIALATAIFPALARLSGDHDGFVETLRRGLRLVVFIGLPASAGLIIVRRPLVASVLQGGAFGPDDVARVAFVLIGYASAVWAYSAIHILTRGFYALGDARSPVRIAVGVVGLNLLLNLTLIWTPLREAGLAWSTAICATVQLVLLGARLRATVGPVVDRSVVGGAARTAAVTGVMAAVVAGGLWLAGPGGSWAASALRLGGAVAAGALIVGGAAVLLRMPELAWLAQRGATDPASD